jgi:hypothetical protein
VGSHIHAILWFPCCHRLGVGRVGQGRLFMSPTDRITGLYIQILMGQDGLYTVSHIRRSSSKDPFVR